MLKISLGFAAGLAVGIAAVVGPPLASTHVAALYSQRMYDCAVRVAGDVRGAHIAGLNSSGPHQFGICVD